MRIKLSDKLVAYLALISGLSISVVAVYYSVAGLVSIFAAAAVPIMVMGVTLEVSKLVATVWLKQNWSIAPKLIRTYLMIAVFVLMLITSMGIFGYLSKAHLDQAVPTGDVAAKVELIDEKIKTQRDNISTAQTALKQMDAQVNEMLSRSTDNKGTERAVQIRRNQAKEREKLAADISRAQTEIAKLNEERAPIAKELSKVEAEVGPIKYIAALIYDTNPGPELLEKAVRWVIILIVFIFDPLAVVLLLASQYSFAWFRKNEEEDKEEKEVKEFFDKSREVARALDAGEPLPQSVKDDVVVEEIEEPEQTKERFEPVASANWPFPRAEEPKEKVVETNPLDDWNKMIAEAEKAASEETAKDDDEVLDSATNEEKIAMRAWKLDHPEGSLKFQRKLFDQGTIDKLPWEDNMYWPEPAQTAEEVAKTYQIFPDLEAQLKAEPETGIKLSDIKKKTSTYIEKVGRDQVTKTFEEGYEQNSEQSESTLWSKIKQSKEKNDK